MEQPGQNEAQAPTCPSPDRRRGLFSWAGLGILLIVVTTAWRLRVIANPANLLVAEEAHYWEWSRRLDWGYFSKPPMIAWLIRLFTEVGGSNAFSVRLGAVVISVGLAALTWPFARALGLTPRSAFFALLAFGVAPLFAAGSVTMTTDTPLMLFWAMALWCVWTATAGGKPWLWPLAGVALGLGMLSKYTMVFLIPSVVIYLGFSPVHRQWLRRPHPYISGLIGLVITAPVIWWNWAHDWVSFRHVASDAGVESGWQIVPAEFVRFIGSQFGVMSPVLFALLVAVVTRVVWRRRRVAWTEAERFLLCMTLPLFLAYAAKALQDKVQGNWTALCFYPWVLLAVGRLDAWARAMEATGRRWRPRVLAAAALVPALVITWFLMEPASFGGATMRFQPAVRHGDWRALARAVDEARAAMPRPSETFVVAREYQTAALLAFYMDGQPQVYLAPDAKRRMSQYDFWPSYETLGGWDAVYVRRGGSPARIPSVADHFTTCAEGSQVDIAMPGTKPRMYSLYPCYGFDPGRFVRVIPSRH